VITTSDLFGSDWAIEKCIENLDRKHGPYIYISTEWEQPHHKLFYSVEPLEDCWLCKSYTQAPDWAIDVFCLTEYRNT